MMVTVNNEAALDHIGWDPAYQCIVVRLQNNGFQTQFKEYYEIVDEARPL